MKTVIMLLTVFVAVLFTAKGKNRWLQFWACTLLYTFKEVWSLFGCWVDCLTVWYQTLIHIE